MLHSTVFIAESVNRKFDKSPVFTVKSLWNSQWVERDLLMLHACFQLIEEFYDLREENFFYVLPDEVKKEFREVIQFWKVRKNYEKEAVLDYTEDSQQETSDNDFLFRAIMLRKYIK